MTTFITRTLADDSVFRAILSGAGWTVSGESLVEFSPLPFRDLPAADWIFFTSRNAVRFFFENAPGGRSDDSESSDRLITCRPDVQWAALGEATAKVLAEYVGKVDFTGSGDPLATAEVFRRLPHPPEKRRVLFPAARHAKQDLQSALNSDFQCFMFEIYNNRPVADPPFSNAGVLVFTSPMNAEVYFSRHTLQEHQQVVAIGQSTARALKTLGVSEITIAAKPSEQALADAVLRLQR